MVNRFEFFFYTLLKNLASWLILKEWVLHFDYFSYTLYCYNCQFLWFLVLWYLCTKTEPPGFRWWTFVIMSSKFTTLYSLIELTVVFPTYLIFSLKIYKSQNCYATSMAERLQQFLIWDLYLVISLSIGQI